jgi:hypothetical protein
MFKTKAAIMLFIHAIAVLYFIGINSAHALDTPTIVATTIGPNQVNLSWSSVANPGWGYKVEIQSDQDTRYSSWTDLTKSLINGRSYLDPWVTEDHYRDRASGSGTALGPPAQFSVFSLQHNTTYNFRVRSYARSDTGTEAFGPYSNTASTTTINPTIIRHVSTTGNDANSGVDNANAWRHIYYAGQQVTAGSPNGTLVIIHGGSYASDYLFPSSGGTSPSSRIVFQVAPGETATITSIGYDTAITFNYDYLVLDGLTINDPSGTNAEVIHVEGKRCVIANTILHGPGLQPTGGGWGPFIYGSYNLFHQNYWHGYGTLDGHNGSTFTNIGNNSYNIVQYSHLAAGGHDNFIAENGPNRHAVLNNLLDGGGGQAFITTGAGSGYNLFEGNICRDQAKFITDYKPAVQVSSPFNVIRRNTFYNPYQQLFELNNQGSDSAHDSKIYNNTFYSGRDAAIWFMEMPAMTNIEIVNNIMWKFPGNSGYGWPVIQVRGDYTGTNIHHNIILPTTNPYPGSDSPNQATAVSFDDVDHLSVASANSAHSTYFNNNTTTAPTFFDALGGDYHLQSTSYGIGLAQAVTAIDPWGAPISAGDSYGAFKYYPLVPPYTASIAAPKGLTVK